MGEKLTIDVNDLKKITNKYITISVIAGSIVGWIGGFVTALIILNK